MDKPRKILIVSSDKNLQEVLNFCFDGWGYVVYQLGSLIKDITPIKKISPGVIVVDVHSASRAKLEICRLIKNDFMTAFIPMIILINKSQLRMQLLDLKQGVDDYLIKPPDPLDLRIRVEMAMRRAQHSFYANPLTGLPSGRIIEEILKGRLKKNTSFSFGYVDIDNFKDFNDVYGYFNGDKVIMQTAYMLYSNIKKYGNAEDFIGHIGGDDFVFITTTTRAKEICQNFIDMFDKISPFHYSHKDRQNRFIVAKDRTNEQKKMPLMSVSVALVNRKDTSELKSMVQINERITEVKRFIKTIPGSKFMIDRRGAKAQGPFTSKIDTKQSNAQPPYKPLGQILLEKRMVSSEQLDEALSIHWRRGVIFGEILKELGFIKEEELTEALQDTKKGIAPFI